MRSLAKWIGWAGFAWQGYWLATHPGNSSLVPYAALLGFAFILLASGRLPPGMSLGAMIGAVGGFVGCVGLWVLQQSAPGHWPLWAEVAAILALPTMLMGAWVNGRPRGQQLSAAGAYLGAVVLCAGLGAWIYARPSPVVPNWVVRTDTVGTLDQSAQTEMLALVRSNDKAGMQRMLSSGRAVMLPAGTRLAMQSVGMATHRVTILDGPFSGRSCLVAVEHVARE